MTGRHSAGNTDGTPGDEPREVERLLSDALHAQARASVGDDRVPPEPRFETHPGAPVREHPGRRRWLAPVAAAAAVVAVVAGAAGITAALSGGDNDHNNDHNNDRAAANRHASKSASTRAPGIAADTASSPAPTAPASATRTPTPVKVTTLNTDGASYGVGMPVVAYFSRKITNGATLQKATTVTVNGKREQGAWYFESSSAGNGPVEGHFRLKGYWPAHSVISVDVPVQGASAGDGMAYANGLSVQFRTGAKIVSVVDEKTHRMTVSRDGQTVAKYPVSLGADQTPTERGTKVVMAKGQSICMHGPGYDECGVRWTQRLTYGGEYLHSAPWNIINIQSGVDTSNGCTNMMPADAQKLYEISEVGDVVQYPNATGPKMQMGAGFGDWNVPWSKWQKGGSVPTH